MDQEPGIKERVNRQRFLNLPYPLSKEDLNTHIEEFESYFLLLLSKDLGRAESYLPILKDEHVSRETLTKARCSRLVGRYYESQSNHKHALVWIEEALALFKRVDNQHGIDQCRLMVLSSRMFLGDYERAKMVASEIIDDPKSSDNHCFKAYVNLGNLAQRRHRYHEALSHFKQALGSPQDSLKKSSVGVLYYNLGNTLVNLGDFDEAEQSFQRALEIFESSKNALYTGYVYQALSYLSTILGQYGDAEKQIKFAREIYFACGDKIGAAYCHLELFQIKIRFNQGEQLLDQAEETLQQFSDLDLHYEKGKLLYCMAQALIQSDDEDLAFSYLEQADEIFQREKNAFLHARCLLSEGHLYNALEEFDEAKSRIEDALDIFKKVRASDFELESIVGLYKLDPNSLTSKLRRRVRDLLKSGGDHQVRIQALFILAEDFYRRNQKKRAIMNLFEAVTLIEESRASIQLGSDRVSFFHDHTSLYERLISWVCQWKNPDAAQLAFRLMELSRNRLFYEQMSKRESVKTDDSSLRALQRLHSTKTSLKRRLTLLLHNSDSSAKDISAVNMQIQEVQKDWDKLKENMRDRQRLGLFFPFKLSPVDFQNLLKDDQMIVAYFISKSKLFRFQLTRTKLELYTTSLPGTFFKNLKLMLGLLKNGLVMKTEKMLLLNDELSELIAPKVSSKIKHLFIVPHKELQQVPFAMLKTNNQYLIQHLTLSICPNLPTLLFSLKKEPSSLVKPLFFFSKSEDDPKAEERSTLLKHYPQAQCCDRFSDRAKMLLEESDFIHFAGHCVIDQKKPGNSYLLISGEKLHLNSLNHTSLNRPFINLASCNSGSHILIQGNEPRGFVSTLLAQGATSILSTLWDIDDHATGRWMHEFYDHFHFGLAKAHRKACLLLIKDGLEPYYWAGFNLVGYPS